MKVIVVELVNLLKSWYVVSNVIVNVLDWEKELEMRSKKILEGNLPDETQTWSSKKQQKCVELFYY